MRVTAAQGSPALLGEEESCCGGGEERTACRAGRGRRPGRVTLRECLACASAAITAATSLSTTAFAP
jgi:hypothetical protein